MEAQAKKKSLVKNTSAEYDRQIKKCREVFVNKTLDYGTAWRILRISSLADQIFIKAQRIRSIEERKTQKVNEPVDNEYIGIINYCVIGLIQLELGAKDEVTMNNEMLFRLYDEKVAITKNLMESKNHDYGEAWREMYISSLTDLILMKLLRMRQIIENRGETLISEGLEANLHDIINYAVFALIKLEEKENEGPSFN